MIVLYKLTWDSVKPKISGIKINTPIVFNADVSCFGYPGHQTFLPVRR